MAESTGSPTAADPTLVGTPRPVFEGEWAKADGHQRQAHMTRVAAWKAANGVKGEGAKGGGKGPAPSPSDPDARHADDLAALQAMIDAPKTLSSDRIRAVEAKQRILRQVDEEHRAEAFGPLVELRHALDLLPPEQRAPALAQLLRVGQEEEEEAA